MAKKPTAAVKKPAPVRISEADKAEKLYLAGRWKEAAAAFAKIRRTTDNPGWVLFRLGRCAQQQGKVATASKHFMNATLTEPGFFSRLRYFKGLLESEAAREHAALVEAARAEAARIEAARIEAARIEATALHAASDPVTAGSRSEAPAQPEPQPRQQPPSQWQPQPAPLAPLSDPADSLPPPPRFESMLDCVLPFIQPKLLESDWEGVIAMLRQAFGGRNRPYFIGLGKCIDPETGLGTGPHALAALYLRCHLERALERGDATLVVPDEISTGEDHKFTRQEVLLSVRGILQTLYGDHAEARDYRLVAAGIASQLRYWDEAIALWEGLTEEYPAQPEYRVQLALAYQKNRNFDLASRCGGELEGAVLSAADRKTLAKIGRDLAERRETELFESFLNALADGEIERAKALFLDRLLFNPELAPDTHLPVLRALMAAAHRIMTGRDDFTFGPAPSQPEIFFGSDLPPVRVKPAPVLPRVPPFRMLSVAGFNYSGSGAVGDYLADFAPVQNLSRTQCHIGAWRMLQALPEDRKTYCRQLCRFVMDACLGMVDTSLSGPEVDSTSWFKRRSLLHSYRAGKHKTAPMVEALCKLIRLSAEASADSPGVLERTLSTFLVWQVIAPQVAPGKSLVVINNDLKASKIAASRLLPGCPTITAFRDPRDQFVAQMRESTFNRRPAKEFVEMIEAHNREYLEGRDGLTARRIPWMELRFETFVRSSALRSEVLKFAGLEAGTKKIAAPVFNPSRSAANIGIHAGYEDQDAIRTVGAMQIYLPPL